MVFPVSPRAVCFILVAKDTFLVNSVIKFIPPCVFVVQYYSVVFPSLGRSAPAGIWRHPSPPVAAPSLQKSIFLIILLM